LKDKDKQKQNRKEENKLKIKLFMKDFEQKFKSKEINPEIKKEYTKLLEVHLANLFCDKNNEIISLLNQIIREYKIKINKERMYENFYNSQCSAAMESFDGCMLFADYNDEIRNKMCFKYSHIFETK